MAGAWTQDKKIIWDETGNPAMAYKSRMEWERPNEEVIARVHRGSWLRLDNECGGRQKRMTGVYSGDWSDGTW